MFGNWLGTGQSAGASDQRERTRVRSVVARDSSAISSGSWFGGSTLHRSRPAHKLEDFGDDLWCLGEAAEKVG